MQRNAMQQCSIVNPSYQQQQKHTVTKIVVISLLYLTVLHHICGTTDGFEPASLTKATSSSSFFSKPIPSSSSSSSSLDATYRFDTDAGGISSDTPSSYWTARRNKDKFNSFVKDTLKPGDTLVFPKGKTFWFLGGAGGENLSNITFVFDGSIKFVNSLFVRTFWPRADGSNRDPCFFFQSCDHLKFTSTTAPQVVDKDGRESSSPFPTNDTRLKMDGNGHGGLIDGGGELWWGYLNYALIGENRPKIIQMQACNYVLFENIELRSSPFWSFWAPDTNNLEVRWSKVECIRPPLLSDSYEVQQLERAFPAIKPYLRNFLSKSSHNLYQLGAFNTDGFDVMGGNIHVHHVDVLNQDDCISVKAGVPGYNSHDILVEDCRASGMGLVIGAIGLPDTIAQNIVFRNCYMPKTDKGIYFKVLDVPDTQEYAGLIRNITVENVQMDDPNIPIWIGPAQQADTFPNILEGQPASLLWPWFDFLPQVTCPGTRGLFEDIHLKDITINNPSVIENRGVGVIRASEDPKYAMKRLKFENVKVNMKNQTNAFYYTGPPGPVTGDSYEDCVAIGDTWPVPTHFEDDTNQ